MILPLVLAGIAFLAFREMNKKQLGPGGGQQKQWEVGQTDGIPRATYETRLVMWSLMTNKVAVPDPEPSPVGTATVILRDASAPAVAAGDEGGAHEHFISYCENCRAEQGQCPCVGVDKDLRLVLCERCRQEEGGADESEEEEEAEDDGPGFDYGTQPYTPTGPAPGLGARPFGSGFASKGGFAKVKPGGFSTAPGKKKSGGGGGKKPGGLKGFGGLRLGDDAAPAPISAHAWVETMRRSGQDVLMHVSAPKLRAVPRNQGREFAGNPVTWIVFAEAI